MRRAAALLARRALGARFLDPLVQTADAAAGASSARHSAWLHHGRAFAAEAAPSASRRGPVSYASLGLTMATGGALIYYFNTVKQQKLQKLQGETTSVGKAALGGPFDLIDQHGKAFTDRNLQGKWALLYFGFTHCPDICPDELEKAAEAVDLVEKATGQQVQPVFISIDPERDSVPQVAQYVADFHPRLLGLTGSPEQTRAAARAYRVYYTKTEEDDDGDYLVDHSIIQYLLNPDGEFVTFYGKNFDAKGMAKNIQQHIAAWQAAEKQGN